MMNLIRSSATSVKSDMEIKWAKTATKLRGENTQHLVEINKPKKNERQLVRTSIWSYMLFFWHSIAYVVIPFSNPSSQNSVSSTQSEFRFSTNTHHGPPHI